MILNHPGGVAHIRIFSGKGMNSLKSPQIILTTSPWGYVSSMKNHQFRQPTSSLLSLLPCIQQICLRASMWQALFQGHWGDSSDHSDKAVPSLRIHASQGKKAT